MLGRMLHSLTTLRSAVNAEPIPCFVADPDSTDRQLIRQMLAADETLRVIEDVSGPIDVDARSGVIVVIDLRDSTLLHEVRLRVGGRRTVMVGISAVAADAVRAFDAGLTDFVRKPCSRMRLALSIVRAKRQLLDMDRVDVRVSGGHDISVSERPRFPRVLPDAMLDENDIYAVFPRGSGARVVGAFGVVNIRMSARHAFAALAAHGMIRVHRTTSVNTCHVVSLHPLLHGCGEVTLTGGLIVPVAKHCMSSLRAVLRLARPWHAASVAPRAVLVRSSCQPASAGGIRAGAARRRSGKAMSTTVPPLARRASDSD